MSPFYHCIASTLHARSDRTRCLHKSTATAAHCLHISPSRIPRLPMLSYNGTRNLPKSLTYLPICQRTPAQDYPAYEKRSIDFSSQQTSPIFPAHPPTSPQSTIPPKHHHSTLTLTLTSPSSSINLTRNAAPSPPLKSRKSQSPPPALPYLAPSFPELIIDDKLNRIHPLLLPYSSIASYSKHPGSPRDILHHPFAKGSMQGIRVPWK